MTGSSEQSLHHAAAAGHHQQAARFHREASRHYQIGKDYAHAAHKALTAHGHALRAQEHGQAASAAYAAHEGNPVPAYLSRTNGASVSTAVATPIILSALKHHEVAAGHHDAAGDHHARAESHSDAGHFVRACLATKEAIKHGAHGLFHAEQASMHHMEHYGAHPSAELA